MRYFNRFHCPGRGSLAGALAAATLLLGGCAGTAWAETCREQVRGLADEHDLTIDPPEARLGETGEAVTAEELARSGGVIDPPATSDPAVIEPPEDQQYGMPTVPRVQEEPDAPEAAGPLGAAERATVESLLIAALAAADDGDDRDCFDKLHEARRFIRQ